MGMVTTEAIWDSLRTINDPEMPISIVDLGLVEAVRLEPSARATETARAGAGDLRCNPPATGESADGVRVIIDVLPTFVGCPALPMIGDEIRMKVGRLSGVRGVEVRFIFDPPWSVDRITPAGRASLERHGVTVPDSSAPSSSPSPRAAGLPDRPTCAAPPLIQLGQADGPNCPYCGSDRVTLDSPYGPTRCRMIYYCAACRNAFEHMKRAQ